MENINFRKELELLKKKVNRWKFLGKKIVFTNGCFDILHIGHLNYLAEAKKLGDILIIGLNSDQSVRKLKGPTRPINTEDFRAKLLSNLIFIDSVVLFNEETPIELIKIIKPDYLVKGGDWKPEQIVGSDIVFKNGGEVKSLKFIDGFSTTNIIEKIKSTC